MFFIVGTVSDKQKLLFPEVYSEPCQKSKTALFPKLVNGQKPLATFAKSSVLDI